MFLKILLTFCELIQTTVANKNDFSTLQITLSLIYISVFHIRFSHITFLHSILSTKKKIKS
jgi:hypothetical protein